MKKIVSLILMSAMVLSLTACGGSSTPANTVFSVDDLPGKTIGVQLGTTGDIYASDYEAEGSTIERYNKGADAIQSLKQGKVDCVIIDAQPAQAFVAKNPELTILEEEFAVEEYDETFLYNLEEVIKIFTFEEQLFVFKAYWDYTTGKLFDESTEAFFFKDISDILTKNNYEYTDCKMNSQIGFWEAVKKHILFVTLFTIAFCGPLGFLISAAIAYNIEKNKTFKVLTKKSETFLITANSGNSTGITILCDEWVSAKNGTRYIRTDGEKIIHAIRKMIEEKKATANE